MKENKSKWKLLATDLVSSLNSLEQQSQVLRWRLVNFEDANSTKVLRMEVETLTGLACNVSRFYGKLEVLNEFDTDNNPKPFALNVDGLTQTNPAVAESEEDGSIVQPTEQAKPLGESESGGTGYDVIQCLGDTEIVKAQGGIGEFETFEAARSSVIEHLEDVIDLCQDRIAIIEEAEERYGDEFDSGTEVATDDLPENDSRVQYICGDHYQPDPEVQTRPLSWFIERLVKLRFPIPDRPADSELMWIAVTSIRGEELVGTLTNEPLYADQQCGDEIVFKPEAVLVVDDGGVTTRSR